MPLDNVAGSSVYFGAKNLMAYAQLCLIADEMERRAKHIGSPLGNAQRVMAAYPPLSSRWS